MSASCFLCKISIILMIKNQVLLAYTVDTQVKITYGFQQILSPIFDEIVQIY